MAKGKNLNPADAFRKAQRKKELKKSKAERQKNRDFAFVKKDTSEIEDELAHLKALPTPSAVEAARIKELEDELERINQKKEEYVEAHPEQRRLVYAAARRRELAKQREEEEKVKSLEGSEGPKKKERKLFNKNGLPRHPERSIYYDPVLNPYGVAPPGMPYVERALLPGEIDSEAEDEPVQQEAEEDDDDDDIVMPEGPPPGAENADGDEEEDGNENDSDDDIPMPDGPPPSIAPPLPPGPPPPIHILPHQSFPYAQPMPSTYIPSSLPPPPPPGFPGAFPPPPPPPPGFSPMPPFPPAFPNGLNPMPAPPPGFFPRNQHPRTQSASAMQDPLSSVPHQTYQAYRHPPNSASTNGSSLPPRPPSLPNKPPISDEAATVSAQPELRDFKKESTAFVPSTLKRKRPAATGKGAAGVNAAPSLDGQSSAETASENPDSDMKQKPDLVGALREKFGVAPPVVKSAEIQVVKVTKKAKPKDDYDKFMLEMGDLLGPATGTKK